VYSATSFSYQTQEFAGATTRLGRLEEEARIVPLDDREKSLSLLLLEKDVVHSQAPLPCV
jgi:hypothetical protein